MTDLRPGAPRQASQATLEQLQAANDDNGRRLLLHGATVLSMDDEAGDLACGDVLVHGTRIEAVAADLSAAAAQGGTLVVDLHGMIVLPGLVDTHRHCWQAVHRRAWPDSDLVSYTQMTHVELAPHYQPEDIYAGTLLSAAGAVATGVTCVLDYSHNTRSPAHADAAIAAWTDAGVRVVYTPCSPMTGPWAQHWPGDLERLRDEYFSCADQLLTLRLGLVGRVLPGIQDHHVLSTGNLNAARRLGLGVSIDGAFGPDVSAQLEELGREGHLAADTTYIHCQDLSDAAWQLIADTGGSVSLAPTSDAQLGLAGAITPVQRALDAGIRPSLGVDVECCLTTDLFTQMRTVLTVQRMMAYNQRFRGPGDGPAPIATREVLGFATAAGAAANGLDRTVGRLTPGRQADITVINAGDLITMPLNNAVATVVLGADSASVHSVFVAGRSLRWAGRPVGTDPGKLRSLVTESRDRVLAAAGHRLDVVQ